MAAPLIGRLHGRPIASELMNLAILLLSLMIAAPAIAGPRAVLDEVVTAWQNRTQSAPATAIDVAFAPRGSPERLVVQFIARCPADLRIALYSFTNKAIAGALVARHRAGVDVRVVADQSQRQERHSVARPGSSRTPGLPLG